MEIPHSAPHALPPSVGISARNGFAIHPYGRLTGSYPQRECRTDLSHHRASSAKALILRKLVGPGVVPQRSDFKNLDCQTALSAIAGAKGIFLRCKIEPLSHTIPVPFYSITSSALASSVAGTVIPGERSARERGSESFCPLNSEIRSARCE